MTRRSLVFLLLALPLLSACAGYSFSSARDSSIRTVAVPVFRNDTYMHGLEQQLTDAIIKEIQRHTSWVVAQSGAQTTLTGIITDAELRPLSLSPRTGLVQEQALDLTLDFTWTGADGKPLVERRNFHAMETFIPERGTSERIELGQHAAVQELARAIVAELRSAW